MKKQRNYLDLSEKLIGKRILICTDVHGCYVEFRQLLEQADFFSKETILIFLGDILDRGPMPLESLQLLYALCQDKKAYAIDGNHENKIKRWAKGNPITINPDMQTSIELAGDWLKEHIDWLEGLYNIIKLPDFGDYKRYCVHAGIRPTNNIKQQHVEDLIYIRGMNRKNYFEGDSWWDIAYSGGNEKLIIYYGHIITDDGKPRIRVFDNSEYYGLDGGKCLGQEHSRLLGAVIDAADSNLKHTFISI